MHVYVGATTSGAGIPCTQSTVAIMRFQARRFLTTITLTLSIGMAFYKNSRGTTHQFLQEP